MISIWVIKLSGLSFPDAIFYSAMPIVLISLVVIFGSAGLLFHEFHQSKILKIICIIVPFSIIGYGIYWLWQNGEDPYDKDLAKLEIHIKNDNVKFALLN